ncbi:PLC-like phosphodiesterase [Aspergillus pseudoustus]|uniref:PLC-like phosphodiesterase n=1 Tax=Aspergillus pseudoustus TaxID=1810923 RepID=A0ABR4L0I5_9EURO
MLGAGLLALLPFAAASYITPRQTNSSSTACNNSPDLCSKSYGDITHLGAHDSPFLRDESTSYSLAGNQHYNTTVQLDAGVRLVSAQVHSDNSQWRLCHSSCSLLDAGRLRTWLTEIKTWLDSNANEVVTVLLVNSDGATASELNSEFEAADLVDYAYTPTSTSAPSSWPTLQELIDAGTRLMVFVASLSSDNSSAAPYLMNEFTYIFENPYDVTSPSNYSCEADRPSSVRGDSASAISANMLPLQNHFLYQTVLLDYQAPNESYVGTTNAPSGGTGNLGDAASTCQTAWGRQPAFILVDFFDQGPAIETVDNLNGVTNAVGRTNVTAVEEEQASSASTYSNVFKGLVDLVRSAQAGANPNMGEWIWVGGDWGEILGGGIPL